MATYRDAREPVNGELFGASRGCCLTLARARADGQIN
jgi:hypothetical protein